MTVRGKSGSFGHTNEFEGEISVFCSRFRHGSILSVSTIERKRESVIVSRNADFGDAELKNPGKPQVSGMRIPEERALERFDSDYDGRFDHGTDVADLLDGTAHRRFLGFMERHDDRNDLPGIA